ncbi:hypothetical protein [Stenotrophomonas maltophilia]|uniref:hypothetical protein n=1 Tax=Stenotrophomonas maltophilia TaxID=40324 RepID=UPI0011B3B9E3|nr:hypothetical protein [Stenotrophomonas maltophilia]
MARQIIDTTTDHGTYKGDPAKTAFEKTNDNFGQLFGPDSPSLPKSGGTLNGDMVIYGGTLRVTPNTSGDQLFFRTEGASGVTLDAVNNANSSYSPLSIRGSAINLNGPVSVSGGISANLTFASTTSNVVLATGASGSAVFLRPNGATNSSGQLVLAPDGSCSAVSFNPTSSADVKDFIEGYSGDADTDLNRLVVITHKYRPEFLESEKSYLSLLAENVHSVVPIATDGDYDVAEKEPYERPVKVTVQVPNESGDGTHSVEMDAIETAWREVTRHVPMNINLMAIVALCVRGHQTKDKRIRELEVAVAGLKQAMADLQAGAS